MSDDQGPDDKVIAFGGSHKGSDARPDAPDDPPAFPGPETDEYHQTAGMTLRDYFAGQALSSFGPNMSNDEIMLGNRAYSAYAMADAMLAEREKTKN